MSIKSFFKELKRRNIFKVATVYAITGWLIIQICAITFPHLNIPNWMITAVIILIFIGFPMALLFAWAFELTPDGIQRTKYISKEESITSYTGKKLNFWIIGLLTTTLLVVLTERIWFASSMSSDQNIGNTHKNTASVAVLPFDDFSPRGDQQWFSDGLTEEILNSLARLPELKVPARTSSFLFKKAGLPIHVIADSLDVNHIVEGSVRRSGDNLRITAQLVRANDGDHLWSNTYDRPADSVFEVQEDIARKIAQALDIYLDEKDRETMFTFGTRNVEAYNAYLKGKSIFDDLHQKSIETPSILYKNHPLLKKANPWFKKAITLDPNFSAPYYFHHEGFAHYILAYPQFKIDTLDIEQAYSYMLDDLDYAIAMAEKNEIKMIYELEKIQYTNDWTRVPPLINELKRNTEAQRLYATVVGLGWSEALVNITGHARLQYQLSTQALKMDPLDRGLQKSILNALSFYAPTDSLLKIKESFSNLRNMNVTLFMKYLEEENFIKADSLAIILDHYVPKLLVELARGQPVNLEKELQTVPDSLKPDDLLVFLHYIVGNKKKANTLARSLDSTILGPQKLSFTTTTATGGYLGFTPDSLPNVGRMFQEANIKIEYAQLGEITLPRIIQKE